MSSNSDFVEALGSAILGNFKFHLKLRFILAETVNMELMILAGISVLAFCICCRLLIHSIRKPVPLFANLHYSRSALRMKKSFAVFAWGLMTSTFLFTLVVSFVQVYTTL